MKKLIATIAMTAAAVAVSQSSAMAGGIGDNYIGPTVNLGNGQSVFGVNGKFGVTDNLSVRPYVDFPSGGTDVGASLTYDWNLSRTPLTPFAGVGVNVATGGAQSNTTAFLQAGADYNVTDSVALLGSINVPLSSQNNGTSVTLGAGLRF